MLTGGKRHGAAIEPTVIADAKPAMKVVCDEVFGPVISLLPYDDIDEVFRTVSEGRFGLQTGIFTESRSSPSARSAACAPAASSSTAARPGVPTSSPMAASRTSGIGREGPRYSIRDMTEERLVLFNY